jgi:ribosomal protein S13
MLLYAAYTENVFRIHKKKYGIGNSISLLLCNHLGYHINFKNKDVPLTYLSDGLRKLLVQKNNVLATNFKKMMDDNLVSQIKLNTYQGNCIRRGLPVHGQRRRTNGNTAKKLLSRLSGRSIRI